MAAAADEGELPPAAQTAAPSAEEVASALQAANWTTKQPTLRLNATSGSKLLDLKNAGAFEKQRETSDAMDLVEKATLEVLKVSQGLVIPANEALETVPHHAAAEQEFLPQMRFRHSCQHHAPMEKWSDASGVALTIQLEAAMRSSLMHLANTYRDKIQDLEDQLSDAKRRLKKRRKRLKKPPKSIEGIQAGEEGYQETWKGAASTKAAPKKKQARSHQTQNWWLIWQSKNQRNLRRGARR